MSIMMKFCETCLKEGERPDESVIFGHYQFDKQNTVLLRWTHELPGHFGHEPIPHEPPQPMYIIEEEPA